jgi:hypothetical protein
MEKNSSICKQRIKKFRKEIRNIDTYGVPVSLTY